MLLQEFNLEIKDKKGVENLVVDHLSRLEKHGNKREAQDVIREEFLNEKLLAIQTSSIAWYVEFVDFIVSKVLPLDLNAYQKKKFLHEVKYYIWDEPYLFIICNDQMLRRCVPSEEYNDILIHCHAFDYSGHFSRNKTATKVL